MKKINTLNNAPKVMRPSDADVKGVLNYINDIQKEHKQWEKLDKEYDRLSKLRFGEKLCLK